jgi:hydroxymethylpyrimidine pyrophosphatase-like HAD family hydrolase
MLPINELSQVHLDPIKLVVFDVDGVLVPRGTKIKSTDTELQLQIKQIDNSLMEKLVRLHNAGFMININSGRGLYMLQIMFRSVLPYVSLTYENGSATWISGKVVQHMNSYKYLSGVTMILSKITDSNIKGWEPKEFITTIHCLDRVPAIEKAVADFPELYCMWNGEAYDIGVGEVQTKALGLDYLTQYLGLAKENTMAIGDNYNDKEMMDAAGISITADKDRVDGDFWVPLLDDRLPAEILVDKILQIVN